MIKLNKTVKEILSLDSKTDKELAWEMDIGQNDTNQYVSTPKTGFRR